MQAEAPGPDLEKLTPHIARTARFLWIFYVSFTALEIMLLYGSHLSGFAPEMTLYQSIAHGFTTMPTGGFSPKGRSIEAFSAVVQWIIMPFMFIAGINFALIWHTATDRLRRLVEDPEWRFYAFSVGVVATLLTGGLVLTETVSEWGLSAVETQVRHGLFQALTIVTTTGYASTDYVQWSTAGQMVLFVAMFIGGCAGSTGGSVKIVRWLVVLKSTLKELFSTVHPDAVQPIRLGDRVLDRDAVRGIFMFIFLYIFVFVTGTAIIVVDCQLHGLQFTPLELLGTAATAVGNVGPSFGQVGPMANFTALPAPSRLTMVLLMWMGRLELITVLVLFTPAYWFS
jgi:trk system potassium uptake protein TrkH